jgi:hypothetical protein
MGLSLSHPKQHVGRGNVDPILAGQMSADYIRAVPTITLTDEELAAVTAAVRRAIETDRFPHPAP